MGLVLLHALPLDGSMWPDSIRALGDSHVAPDLYGFGDTIEDWAAGVLDVAGSGPLTLVGNSVGGSCALEVARLAPDRVGLLVLVGAKAGHRPEPEFRDAAVRLLSEQGMAGAWPTYWEPLFGPNAEPDAIEAARRIAFAQDIDDVIRGVRVFHGRPDRSDLVRTWPGPVVVVSGEHDRTPANGSALAASAPNGTFHLVEDAGHYLTFEQPAALQLVLGASIHLLGGQMRPEAEGIGSDHLP